MRISPAALVILATTPLALLPGFASASPTVQALYLPQGATIKPEGKRVLMASRGDVIAASIVVGANEAERVAVWRDNKVDVLNIDTQFENGMGPGSQTLGSLTADGQVIVNAGYPFSGAYSGINYHALAYTRQADHEVSFPHCNLAGNTGDPIVQGANGRRLAVTFESPSLINLDSVDSGMYAPNAAIVTTDSCDVIGRANIRAVRGRYAAGFRGYLGKVLAPNNMNAQQQKYVAVRWVDGKLQELGQGVALDVSSQGVCVGATAPPGDESYFSASGSSGATTWSNTYRFDIPHAQLWRADGSALTLEGNLRSVAYAVDDTNKVVGMLRDANGRHYAFLWEEGRLKLLDVLLDAPRWRFESAYAFTADGGILGIGTHDGVATAFIVHLD